MIKGNMIPPIQSNERVIISEKKEVKIKGNDSKFNRILNKKIRKLNKYDEEKDI